MVKPFSEYPHFNALVLKLIEYYIFITSSIGITINYSLDY